MAAPQPFRHSEARLIFDSATQPTFVGLRAGRRPPRRLLVQDEHCEIDLEISPDPASEGLQLTGQVSLVPEAEHRGWLRLARAYDRWFVPIDQGGEFRVDGLEAGVYQLEVSFKDRSIEVPLLAL